MFQICHALATILPKESMPVQPVRTDPMIIAASMFSVVTGNCVIVCVRLLCKSDPKADKQ